MCSSILHKKRTFSEVHYDVKITSLRLYLCGIMWWKWPKKGATMSCANYTYTACLHHLTVQVGKSSKVGGLVTMTAQRTIVILLSKYWQGYFLNIFVLIRYKIEWRLSNIFQYHQFPQPHYHTALLRASVTAGCVLNVWNVIWISFRWTWNALFIWKWERSLKV